MAMVSHPLVQFPIHFHSHNHYDKHIIRSQISPKSNSQIKFGTPKALFVTSSASQIQIDGVSERSSFQYQLVDRMEQQAISLPLDSKTCASFLQVFTNAKALEQGKKLHVHMLITGLDRNPYLKTELLALYAKCGSVEAARLVFDSIEKHSMFSWSTMIGAYTRCGFFQESIDFCNRMRCECFEPDIFVLVNVLKACAALGELQQGRLIHNYVVRTGVESDVFIQDDLVEMYAKCGKIEDARQVFDKTPQRDVVSWNVMIAGYGYNGLSDEALKVFTEMRQRKVRPNLMSWNALIEAYSNEGNCDEAFNLLRQMQLQSGSLPNVITWNTVIGGYARNGHAHEALRLFRQMTMSGEHPNEDTILIVLSLFLDLEDPPHGKDMHGYIIKNGFFSDASVRNALADMYVKVGKVDKCLMKCSTVI